MNEMDIREEKSLVQAYIQADNIIMKNYISELAECEVVPLREELKNTPVGEMTRIFKVNKLVYDKSENTLDKLSNVYNTLAGSSGSLITIIHSNGDNVDFYIGTKSEPQLGAVTTYQKTLEKAFKGNFPGSELSNLKNSQIEELINRIFANQFDSNMNVVSAVSGIASLKDDNKDRFVQGIEKFIDAMKGEKYSVVFIADPISQIQLDNIRIGYENLYTQLVPFAKSDLSLTASEGVAITKGITKGFTKTVGRSISQTQSYTEGKSSGVTTSTNKSKTRNYGAVMSAAGSIAGGIVGSVIPGLGTLLGGAVGGFAGNILGNLVGSTTTGESENKTVNQYYQRQNSETTGQHEDTAVSVQENTAEQKTMGNSKSLRIEFEDKRIISLLQKINQQLERLQQCEDFGMWNCAAYFIAPDTQTAKVASNTYKALIRGDGSSIESSCINIWDNKNKNNLVEVTEYIRKLYHPLININMEGSLELPFVTPGSLVSGQELPIHISLPKKSIPGLPVIECTEFGRNITIYDNTVPKRTICLGKVFHMGRNEITDVNIDVDSLTMHTFVTGSTGSGKSNTIYTMIDKLAKQGIKFLIVEPCKGEYKKVFGGRSDIRMFGTNQNYSEVLKINPFKFMENIHVLEHIDRLLEIFNACWPMYAAMPAILKEAIEQTYTRAGWDLEDSINYSGENIYPNFSDLLEVLPDIITNSEYSSEIKSNYIGALVTRIKSLTNGIYGNILSCDEIGDDLLFNSNCIVDLSRVGSVETKAFLMGILVMRLIENRISHDTDMNNALRHITVLEEAHNLLRRISFEQAQEGANLQGKAVEMVSNAIAEMRTYGEGFIIADQAPGLLDMSVIRNTNTKIILRLPDDGDRQLVGKAANLNKLQIDEIAKLRVGVAALYQNNWVQPILCAVNEYTDMKPYNFNPNRLTLKQQRRKIAGNFISLLTASRVADIPKINKDNIDIEMIKQWLKSLKMNNQLYIMIVEDLERFMTTENLELWTKNNYELLSKIIYNTINGERILSIAKNANGFDVWNKIVVKTIREIAELNQNEDIETAVIQCLLRAYAAENEEMKNFYFLWVENMKRK